MLLCDCLLDSNLEIKPLFVNCLWDSICHIMVQELLILNDVYLMSLFCHLYISCLCSVISIFHDFVLSSLYFMSLFCHLYIYTVIIVALYSQLNFRVVCHVPAIATIRQLSNIKRLGPVWCVENLLHCLWFFLLGNTF